MYNLMTSEWINIILANIKREDSGELDEHMIPVFSESDQQSDEDSQLDKLSAADDLDAERDMQVTSIINDEYKRFLTDSQREMACDRR